MARAWLLLYIIVFFGCVPDAPTVTAETRSSATKAHGAVAITTATNPAAPSAAAQPTGAAPSPPSCGTTPTPEVDSTELDPFFAAKMDAANVPGLAVAVVGGGRIKWVKGYGLANIEQSRPVTPDTLFLLASTSKAVTAVALMELVDDPNVRLDLDQDVNERLPFPVRNPSFPDRPITIRMLMTHTSSLVDSPAYWNIAEPHPLVQGDSPIPLLDFDRDYVARPDSWGRSPPGSFYQYSNTGASLVGLLVEQITRSSLQEDAKRNIFDRLGMNETSYFLRDLDPAHIAMPYANDDALTPLGHYGYPDYPDGQLRTSANQLARFLLMFGQKGECGGARILSEANVAAIGVPQVPALESTEGLTWYYSTADETRILGHDGADAGVTTEMFLDPTTGNGYLYLANQSVTVDGDESQIDAMADVSNELMHLANTLP